ncbi:MAG: hypothetical protein P9L99_08465 [Candidatus Lernaella stagnicola]|nr:hypothetical protein [Candidatus Lernaella stagnicola]
MKSLSLPLSFLCLLFLLCIVPACADDDADDAEPPDYDEWIAQGKHYLIDNDAEHAARAFNEALELQPDSVDAKFGLVLAGPMRLLNFVDQILSTITNITFDNDWQKQQTERDYNEENTHPIHLYLVEKLGYVVWDGEAAYADLLTETNLQFQLDELTLSIDEAPLLSFGGEFDEADLHFFAALNSALNGVIHILLAHNLSFDYTAIGVPLSDEEMHIIETIDMIIGLLDGLLASETFPDFMYLLEEGGVENMQEAGCALGHTFTRLDEMLAALAAETDDQSDDQIRFDDLNGNGHFDLGVDDLLLGDVVLDAELAVELETLAVNYSAAFYEGTPHDVNSQTIETLHLADLNGLLTALGLFPLELGPLTLNGLPDLGGLPVGPFFADPAPDAVRGALQFLVTLWTDPGSLFD